MSVWVWSAKAALLAGAVLFLVILVPVLWWQYRRFGRLSPARLLGSAAVTVYLVSIVTYTWLPLPERSQAWCDAHAVSGLGLAPFAFVDQVRQAVSQLGWRATLQSATFLQVAFNVVLFIPWGIVAKGFLRRSIPTATLSGLLASLVVEATQATGLWGIYPCAYRFADVDDLITNTAGALLGALVAPAVLWWMPGPRALVAARLEPRPVTVSRRWTGMLIDAFATVVLGSVLVVGYRVVGVLLGTPATGHDPIVSAFPALAVLVVFLVPAWNGGASGSGSAGHNSVWLTPVWDGPGPSDGTRLRRLVRAAIVPTPYVLAAALPDGGLKETMTLLSAATVMLSVLLVPFTNKRGLSGLLTGAKMVDLRSGRQEPDGR